MGWYKDILLSTCKETRQLPKKEERKVILILKNRTAAACLHILRAGSIRENEPVPHLLKWLSKAPTSSPMRLSLAGTMPCRHTTRSLLSLVWNTTSWSFPGDTLTPVTWDRDGDLCYYYLLLFNFIPGERGCEKKLGFSLSCMLKIYGSAFQRPNRPQSPLKADPQGAESALCSGCLPSQVITEKTNNNNR